MVFTWTAGLPSGPGVYWFDPGLRFVDRPMVIRVHPDGTTYGYGDYGSGPIGMYYSPEVCTKACWAPIEPAGQWFGPEAIDRDGARAWVRDPKGYLGFGLLRRGYDGKVGGSVLWVNHSTSGAVHGGWMGKDHQFSPVTIPNVLKG